MATTPTITNDPSADDFYEESAANPITTHSGITVPANRSLVVLLGARDAAPPGAPTSVTFAGQAMTLLQGNEANQSQVYGYALTDPNIATRTGDIVVTWPSSRVAQHASYLFVANLDPDDPFDVGSTGDVVVNNVTHECPSINTQASTLVLHQCSMALSAGNTGVPTNMTERLDFVDPPDGSGALGHYVSSRQMDAGGATGVVTLTLTGGKTGASQLFSLNGAAAGGASSIPLLGAG